MMGGFLAFGIGIFLASVGYSAYKKINIRSIKVIDKKEIEQVLSHYQLKSDFVLGKIVCPITRQKITYTNIGIIRKGRKMQKPVFISNAPDVMRKASDYSDDLLYRLSYN